MIILIFIATLKFLIEQRVDPMRNYSSIDKNLTKVENTMSEKEHHKHAGFIPSLIEKIMPHAHSLP